MANVQLIIQENGVAVVTLDQPQSKVNLLGSSMMKDLGDVIDQLALNPLVKGLIIISGKADNFVAGADIGEIRSLQQQEPIKAYEASRLGKEVFAKIGLLPFKVVAAINGTCLGGGTELALACDYRIATDNSKTKIGLPEVNLGFIPGWGGTVRLPRLIGLPAALGLILTGKTVEARKAWKMGLVDETCTVSDLQQKAQQVVLTGKVRRFPQSFAAGISRWLLERNPLGRKIVYNQALKGVMAQTKGKYPAPLEALKVALAAVSKSPEQAFKAESEAFAQLAVSQVSRNLVNIFFAQQESKKAPSNATCTSPLKTIGVLGAGVMGAGIAQAAAYSGFQVRLYDLYPQALEKGLKGIKTLFDGLVSKRKLTAKEAGALLSSIKATSNYADLADCDLVIEAVVEKLAIKLDVLGELEKVITRDFIFATNTSSLSVSTLARSAAKPENVVGVHFFNPVYKMPLVEIVRGEKTSDNTVACALVFASKLGKTTVQAADSPGFVVNRILAPYMREAAVLAEQGVPLKDIDRAMTSFGMPMGPLTLLDEVGLDIAGEVIKVIHAALGQRMAPPVILHTIGHLKLQGKKGGKGIYLYDQKGKQTGLNPDVIAAINSPPSPKTKGEIQDRLTLVMINEAARCLEEGIINSPAQLDLAMIMGTGFSPFLGGPLRYADSLGTRIVHQKLELLSHVAGENYRPCNLLCKLATSGHSFYND